MDQEETEIRKRNDVKWVLSTEQGRRFLWDLLSVCGVYRSLEGDPNSMLIQEGSRRIGLHLLGITTDASEDLVFSMMLEAKNKKLEEQHEYTKRANDSSAGTTSSGSDADYDNATGGYDSGESLSSSGPLIGAFT